MRVPADRLPTRLSLVNFLLGLNPSQVRTVAYIPKEARADAALVALACDQIVMNPKAVIGGPGILEIWKEDAALLDQQIRQGLAPRKGRSWSLMAASWIRAWRSIAALIWARSIIFPRMNWPSSPIRANGKRGKRFRSITCL